MMSVRVKEGLPLPIPEEWANEMGVETEVELTRTGQGFHVKPINPAARKSTWDEIFANKLPIGKWAPEEAEGEVELTGDDYFL